MYTHVPISVGAITVEVLSCALKGGVGVMEVLLGSNGVTLAEWLTVAMVTSTEWVGAV